MITDPYKVLGLEPGATDEQVKSAYKELVKKYHPDRYQNNPLEELAEEKLREINEAYDMIMKGNRSRDNSGYRQDARNIDPEYQKVRRSIDMGNLKQAQDLLDNIPNKHTAEWLFLSGMISYRRGWYDDAMGKIQQAVSIEPWTSPDAPSTSTARSTTRAPCSAPTVTPCGFRWPPPSRPSAPLARGLKKTSRLGTGQAHNDLYHGLLVWTTSPVLAKGPLPDSAPPATFGRPIPAPLRTTPEPGTRPVRSRRNPCPRHRASSTPSADSTTSWRSSPASPVCAASSRTAPSWTNPPSRRRAHTGSSSWVRPCRSSSAPTPTPLQKTSRTCGEPSRPVTGGRCRRCSRRRSRPRVLRPDRRSGSGHQPGAHHRGRFRRPGAGQRNRREDPSPRLRHHGRRGTQRAGPPGSGHREPGRQGLYRAGGRG